MIITPVMSPYIHQQPKVAIGLNFKWKINFA